MTPFFQGGHRDVNEKIFQLITFPWYAHSKAQEQYKTAKSRMNFQLVKNGSRLSCPPNAKSDFITLILWNDEKCAF